MQYAENLSICRRRVLAVDRYLLAPALSSKRYLRHSDKIRKHRECLAYVYIMQKICLFTLSDGEYFCHVLNVFFLPFLTIF